MAAAPLVAPQAVNAAGRQDWRQFAYEVGTRVCRSDMQALPLAGAILSAESRFGTPQVRNWRRVWTADAFTIEATRSDGPQTLNFIAFLGGPQKRSPLFRIVLGERCDVRGAEMVQYEGAPGGRPTYLHLFGRDLKPRAEPIPFNPPLVPADGEKANCVRVAILDNGVNYGLAAINARLARDDDGQLVGYDFWEDDDRPFDFGVPPTTVDPRLSLFSSPQHGTSVASVLIADAPESVCLAPYRYFPADPRDDIGEIIDRIGRDGVRAVVLATGRDRPWPAFRDAMRRHPDLLFIAAAGNQAFDLAARPVYPMSYDEPNLLVVAASQADGSLWPPTNRGEGVVDLAVPATEVPGLDFQGKPVRLTGTSYASPRIGALAGILAARHPDWNGPAIARGIMRLAAAEAGPGEGFPILSETQFRAILDR